MSSNDSHYDAYNARFEKRFGDKAPGIYVKFSTFLIARLTRVEFSTRFQDYNELHLQCVEMLREGATLNDTLMREYQEAAAWLAIDPPNLNDLFRGEMGAVPGGETHARWKP